MTSNINSICSLVGVTCGLALLILSAIKGMDSVFKDGEKVGTGFDEIEKRAMDCDVSELAAVKAELRAFYRKNCWHKYHSYRYREIMGFLAGRIGQAKIDGKKVNQ